MDQKLTSFADRLNAKLKGLKDKELVREDDTLIDLLDAHLDLVIASHGSCHLSCVGEICERHPGMEATAQLVSSSK